MANVLFLSSVNYHRIYSFFFFLKSRFVEDVLFYPKSEVIGFPKIEGSKIESAMFMITLSLTR